MGVVGAVLNADSVDTTAGTSNFSQGLNEYKLVTTDQRGDYDLN